MLSRVSKQRALVLATLTISLGLGLGLGLGLASCKKKVGGVRAEGRVYDAITGDPLANIEVVVEQIGGGDKSVVTTDKKGHFMARGKLDVAAPFEVRARSAGYLEAKAATPRLPFKPDLRIELVSNDIANGFSVPVNGIVTKAKEVSAKVTLPPPDKPDGPLVGTLESTALDTPIPKLDPPTGSAWRAVVAPPPDGSCACIVQKLIEEAGVWRSDPTSTVTLTTWQPPLLMTQMRMQVLEVPADKVTSGRWVFWPTKPPPYESMAALAPEIYRQGYVFDVK